MEDSLEHRREAALLMHTTSIVAAYVQSAHVPRESVPDFVRDVHGALASLVGASGKPAASTPAERPSPAVPIKKSIQDDFIVCLEDGKKFKSLKRHIMTAYGLTPDAYREKWGLDPSYPMVAPNYAAARSQLARDSGLGRPRSSVQ